jgi:hypothetical protein
MNDYNKYFFDPDGDLNDLSEEERQTIKQQSMLNTYKLIVNNYDFDIFPNRLFWLLTDYDALTVFDILIDYFADLEREEYEKCAELKNIKEKLIKNRSVRTAKKGKFTYTITSDDEKDLK